MGVSESAGKPTPRRQTWRRGGGHVVKTELMIRIAEKHPSAAPAPLGVMMSDTRTHDTGDARHENTLVKAEEKQSITVIVEWCAPLVVVILDVG